MRALLFSNRAVRDLDQIWDFTADRWDVDQADHYLLYLDSVCQSIALGKVVARSAEDIHPGYRKVAAGSHVLFFKEDEFEVEIVRVLHERMDLSSHLP
jgi:toxin ParE1/3/4